MIPVMIVPLLTAPELLHRMIDTIDHDVEQLIIIDNGANVEEQSLQINPFIKRINLIRLPKNLGVAGSWNLGIKVSPFSSSWLICNFDVTWPAGELERFANIVNSNDLILSAGQPEWCVFSLGENVVDTVGLFDERFHPAYFEDNDYIRRCQRNNISVIYSDIYVNHENSSTLAAGYDAKNRYTFQENSLYFQRKQSSEDFTEGHWNLSVRRRNTWD